MDPRRCQRGRAIRSRIHNCWTRATGRGTGKKPGSAHQAKTRRARCRSGHKTYSHNMTAPIVQVRKRSGGRCPARHWEEAGQCSTGQNVTGPGLPQSHTRGRLPHSPIHRRTHLYPIPCSTKLRHTRHRQHPLRPPTRPTCGVRHLPRAESSTGPTASRQCASHETLANW